MGDEGMVGSISKGPVHRKIDKGIAQLDRQKRERFAEDLRNPRLDYFFEVLARHLPQQWHLTTEEINYLREKWYWHTPHLEDWHGWWLDQQPIEHIIREGLALALEKSIGGNQPLPIDSYWMTGGYRAKVQVFIALGPAQVTRLIYTPPSGSPAGRPRPQPVDIWVVKEDQVTTDQVELKFEHKTVVGRQSIVRWQRQEFRER